MLQCVISWKGEFWGKFKVSHDYELEFIKGFFRVFSNNLWNSFNCKETVFFLEKAILKSPFFCELKSVRKSISSQLSKINE